MIASISGRVQEANPDSLVVEVGGVGLLVNVPAVLSAGLRSGESVSLHTYLVVREDLLTCTASRAKRGAIFSSFCWA